MRSLTVHALIGSIKSGKSREIETYPREWVRFRPGRVLRDMVGVEAMAQSTTPNAPPEVDAIVSALLLEAIHYATEAERPLVLDGYPRSVRQVSDFLSLMMDRPGELYVLFKTVRRKPHPAADLDAFDRQRLAESQASLFAVERKIVAAAEAVHWIDMEVNDDDAT